MLAPERGFSLLETMVALAIWLVALLALAGVQARVLQDAREAALRSHIDAAVENLAQAIQARPESHWVHYLETAYDDHAASPDCPLQCDPARQAEADLSRFKQALRNRFSMAEQARGVVCRGDVKTLPTQAKPGCGATGPVSIRVVWRSRHGRSWQEHADVWLLRP